MPMLIRYSQQAAITVSTISDCRVQKRASASLSLRLPRGRPPGVGVDSSFFNLTPPSAEAVTPDIEQTVSMDVILPATTEEKDATLENPDKPKEEENVKVEESAPPILDFDTSEKVIPVEVETDSTMNGVAPFVMAERPDVNPNPHS